MAEVVGAGVGVVFLLSALAKARHPRRFAEQLTHYGIDAPAIQNTAAGAVIALEGAIATAYLLAAGSRVMSIATLLFLAGLGLVVTRRMLAEQSHAPCLCFGVDSREPISMRTLIRIGVVMLAAAYCLASSTPPALDAAPRRLDLVASAASGLLLVGISHLLINVMELASVLRIVARLPARIPSLSSQFVRSHLS